MASHPRTRSLAITSIAVLILLSPALVARNVGPDQARVATETFLRTQITRPTIGSTKLMSAVGDPTNEKRSVLSAFREIRDDDGSILAYIADLEPQGFVATSANTGIVPVVAYSFKSSFPSDIDKDNPAYHMLIKDMKLRNKALDGRDPVIISNNINLWEITVGDEPQDPTAGEFRQWPTENTTSTGGWLETAWHQDLPFNDFCPLDPVDGLRSYVGCVATAMAQILNYHQQCEAQFDESDSYTIYSGLSFDQDSLLYDFPSFDELNVHIQAAQAKYDRGEALDYTDAAALSFACGISCGMDYSSLGSGAPSFDAHKAFLEKFGYYSAEMTGGMSGDSFLIFQENIINGLPVYLSIAPEDGWGGHVIVCDGYNTDDQYHLNFGWGAPYPEPITEMWYHLPSDLFTGLSLVTEAIVNIEPSEPLITVSPVSLNFSASPGNESASKSLRLESGPDGVSINSISSPEGFVLAYPGENYSDQLGIADLQDPDDGFTLRVKFRPEREGGYHGTVQINYNGNRVKYVALKGSAFSGGTEIPAGPVSGTWSHSGSPYFIRGDIEISDNSELTIEPGVRVIFVGHCGITVGENARLTAVGNHNSPIEFTASNRDLGWSGIKFIDSGDDDILTCCTVTYAKKEAEMSSIPADPTDEGYMEVFGAAIYCSSSSPTITSCTIANNESGAIQCFGSDLKLTNTVIANNSMIGGDYQCGGMYITETGRPVIKNCTIVNNSPGGIQTESEDGVELINTILWGNDRYQILTSESVADVSFCNVQDGYKGHGNIDSDPSFFDPSPGIGSDYDGISANWALKSSSPCINSGRQTSLPDTDIAGNSRFGSYLVDIGAYENQSELPLITIAPTATVDAGFTPIGDKSSTSIEIVNTGDLEFTIDRLNISDPEGVFLTRTQIFDHPLAPGDSVEVEILFDPFEERKYEGALVIRSNCSNGPVKNVALYGVGVAGKVISGGAVSGLWTKAESPYTVTGDIYIPQGRTLTIEPGVVIKFAGHFKFTIGQKATLQAIGTKQENIIFTPTDPNEGWFGMRFINTGDDDILDYCTLEYSKKSRQGKPGFDNQMGGAIFCAGSWEPEDGEFEPSSPTIANCLIANNEAQQGAGIMITDWSEALIVHNRIVDNSADLVGGGIYALATSSIIANNVIAHNSAFIGGGILNYEADPWIINNTIVHNRPSGLHLDTTTRYVPFWVDVMILNNIIWENEIYMSDDVNAGEYDIRFNDIQGGWDGEGNINVDPLFADAENRDYHLKSQAGCWDPVNERWIINNVTSPCIDTGDPDQDAGDEPGPNGGRANMGAYGTTEQASKSF